jgi:hypothetical protein
MHLKVTWPHTANPPLRENMYLGGWHATEPLSVEWTQPPAAIQPVCIQGDNWFLISNTSPLHQGSPGLIHSEQRASEDTLQAVAFRGYMVDPPIHSYSPSQEIFTYWKQRTHSTQPNGVFSAACIRNSGRTLELVADAFGMDPLYYRNFRGLILFATNSKYLAAHDDEPDYIAWRSLIQAGFIVADRTLSASIERIPAGHILCFQDGHTTPYAWFDYNTLPEGTRNVDERTFAEVNEAFHTALSRCLRLKATGNLLPLSSGYDSRLLLAGLIDSQVPFETVTLQMFEKGYWDLDRFISEMAKDFGFPHRIIPFPGVQKHARDDAQRRILLSAECELHGWAIPLMEDLPDAPCLFFDGLAGDVLGNAEFIVPGTDIPELYVAPETDTALFAQYTVSDEFDNMLQPKKWPSAEKVRNELLAYLELLPPTMNRATVAKLLLRTRRSIALWSTQMLPAGHVVVCPFLDLDYVRTTLSYHPAHKHRTPLQKGSLQRYWPRYFAYPGSKAIPADFPLPDYTLYNKRQIACFKRLKQEILETNTRSTIRQLLTRKANIRLWLAFHNNSFALRSMWAFKRFLDVVAGDAAKIACWDKS